MTDESVPNSPRRRGRPRSAAVEAAMSIDVSKYEDAPALPQAAVKANPTGPKIPWRARKKVSSDPLDIPKHLIPAGMIYEWKTKFVYGQESDHHMAYLQDAGAWSPVPADRPGHERLGTKHSREKRGEIGWFGLVLMERPVKLDNEARAEEYAAARGIREIQMQKLGLTPRGQLPTVVQKARRSMEEPTG